MFAPGSAPRGCECLLVLSDKDNVGVATTALEAGARALVRGQTLELLQPAPMGHKIALCAIAAGEKVIKYGAAIGTATHSIAAGEHVHTHNLQSDYLPTVAPDGPRDLAE